MGRAVRDTRLDTREARLKLAATKEPYWRLVTEGAHLGYFRGHRVGKWVARFRKPGGGACYLKRTLGEADDIRDADGEDILTFRQADAAARKWFEAQASGRVAAIGPFSVSDALDEYLAGFRGKSVIATKSRVDQIIRPELGHYQVGALTAKIISEWHLARSRSPARLRTRSGALSPNVRPATDPDAIRRRRATANRDLTVLKAALNRAADHRECCQSAPGHG